MRRSKMIEALTEPIDIGTEGDQLWLWYREADAILTRIEKLGMLPPVVEGKVILEEQSDGSIVITSLTWEAEDNETK